MEKRDFEHKPSHNLTTRSSGARATLLQPGHQLPVFTKKKTSLRDFKREMEHSSPPRLSTEPLALVVVILAFQPFCLKKIDFFFLQLKLADEIYNKSNIRYRKR